MHDMALTCFDQNWRMPGHLLKHIHIYMPNGSKKVKFGKFPYIFTHIYLGNPRQAMKSQVLLHGAVGTGPGRGHRRFEGRGWSGGEHNIIDFAKTIVFIYIYICMFNLMYIYICICIVCMISHFQTVRNHDEIWVNYNDLTVLPHWKSWLVREIILKWP